MAAAKNDELLTAGGIAKAIGVSDAKVKSAIKTLGLQPKAKKGPCAYYGPDAVAKVKRVKHHVFRPHGLGDLVPQPRDPPLGRSAGAAAFITSD